MDDWIGDILSKIDIVKVIARYINLRPQGDAHWGLCPFHHEKSTSFNVSASKQVYHCFGCKESGNAITFIKKIESVGFWDAIIMLCKEFGLEVPESKFHENEKKDYTKLDNLYKVLKDAAIHYHHNLKTPQGKQALEYLHNRGIADDMIVKFGLGVSVDSTSVIGYLTGKGHSYTDMLDAGITNISNTNNHDQAQTDTIGITTPKDVNYYDVFYGRLIVPIINASSQVVGFGARDLSGNSDKAKYKNSKLTQLFDKSNVIYSINNLKKIKQTKGSIPHIILTEGYMDVIALHGAGFDTAVASMGTAFTHRQARQLKNYSENVYVSFDGDTAGQAATIRSLDILTEVGLIVRVISLPQGQDPDEFIKAAGSQEYQKMLNRADTLTAFKIKSLLKGVDLKDTAQRTNFAIEACKVVAALPNSIEREEYRGMLANLSGYSIQTLQQQEEQLDRAIVPKDSDTADTIIQKTHSDKLIEFLLASFLQNKEWANYEYSIYEFLTTDLQRQVYRFAIDRYKSPDPSAISIATLYSWFNDDKKEELTYLINFDFEPGDNTKNFERAFVQVKKEFLKKQKRELAKEMDQAKDYIAIAKIRDIEDQIKSLNQKSS